MHEHGLTPEETVGLWVAVGLCGVLVWRAVRWFFGGALTPNPWGAEVDAQIERSDAVPLCTRCLESHDPEARFCPDCGAPVSALVNFNPYLYVFSMGNLLRIGSFGEFRRGGLTVAGFVAVSLAEYAIFAPIYWFFLARNIHRLGQPGEEAPPIIASPG